MTEGWNDGMTEGHGESSIAPLFQSGAIKNTNYVEATVRNMYTKYRLNPLDSF